MGLQGFYSFFENGLEVCFGILEKFRSISDAEGIKETFFVPPEP